MGLFRDLKKLSEQGKQLRDQYPVQHQVSDASAKLAEATSMMEQLNEAHSRAARVLANGVDAVAVITGVRQRGAMLNHQPLIDIDLVVTMPNGVPVPVSRSEAVALIHLARAEVGNRLPVRVDPSDPTALWINWASSPRS